MNAPSIDGFTLLRELGRGGMGIVYEASHPSAPERRLALKVLLAHADPNPDSLARFEREARLMGAINHPHVIRVHTFGRCPQGPYLVTEFIEGQDLKQLRQAHPLPEPHLLQLMIGVCHAVEALHQHKILHRDLKPDNVMVRPDGSPVLLDFGLAREVGGERLTQTGASMGTPQYMAPEQAAGESPAHMNERTDVYGLGGILYFLIAGRPPFEGSNAIQIVAQVLDKAPDPTALEAASPEARAVCLKALSKERLRRYRSVGELRADLERALAQQPVHALARRPLRLAAALLGLALLAGGVWALRASSPPAPPPSQPPPETATQPPTRPPTGSRQAVAWTLDAPERADGVGVWFVDDETLITWSRATLERWDLRARPPEGVAVLDPPWEEIVHARAAGPQHALVVSENTTPDRSAPTRVDAAVWWVSLTEGTAERLPLPDPPWTFTVAAASPDGRWIAVGREAREGATDEGGKLWLLNKRARISMV